MANTLYYGDNLNVLREHMMIAARLVELHRVLKSTGSIYLYCDPTASHYLRIVLDTIFGIKKYRNEITWKRTSSHNDAKRKFSDVGDIIFFYSKPDNYYFDIPYSSYSKEYLEKFYKYIEPDGRIYRLSDLRSVNPRPNLTYDCKGYHPHPNGWTVSREKMEKLDAEGRLVFPKSKGGRIAIKRYPDERQRMPVNNIWPDIQPIQAQAAERLGDPTQKPLQLIERIIEASSNPGDIILDPFSGCGTAISAAQKLGRQWIGIDISYLAIAMHKSQLKDMFNLEPGKDYRVIGGPEDLESARQLAHDDRYQFQWWALSLAEARPLGGHVGEKTGKKGSDRSIDSIIPFIDDSSGNPKQVMIHVKSGHVNLGIIWDLRGVVERENAAIVVRITLEPASSEMCKEALSAGFYASELWQRKYPRLQILSIEEPLGDKQIQMPATYGTFKTARRVKKQEGQQTGFEF